VNIRQLSTILFTALMALPASGLADTPGPDAYVRMGVSKIYSCQTSELQDTLKNSLCRNKSNAKGNSALLTCDAVSREVDPIKFVLLLGLGTDDETAEAWARIGSAPQGAQVTLGVILKRNQARVKTAKGHFFKPYPWAQKVWAALDQRAKQCGKK
jgi:hypothetical protein